MARVARTRIARPTDAPALVHRALQAAAEPAVSGEPRLEGAEREAEAAREAQLPVEETETCLALPAPSAEPAGVALEPFPIPAEELPRHVAIIMDGNRRWARQRGLHEVQGHAAGVDVIRTLVRHAVDRGIAVLSLYAFSRENWGRSDDEVAALFGLLEQVIRSETDDLVREGVRVSLLGRLEELPAETRRSILEALEATSGGHRMRLNIAFNYAGRTELVDAARRLVARGLQPEEIDEDAISRELYTAGQPDPDLLIRTGGEERLSNFLIWQAAYAEFYFCPLLWPDFGPGAFDAALLEFASRHRRFGL